MNPGVPFFKLIGAGCVVFKSVPANSLMIEQAGNKIIKPLPSNHSSSVQG